MRYLIDGYNLMFRVLRAGDDLQAQRERIIRDLNAKIQFLDLDATIVFDAHYQIGDSHRTHYRQVEILFTAQGETADEHILSTLKKAKEPSEYTVVTSDKKLAWLSRRKLAKTETVEEFLSLLARRFKNKIRRMKEVKLVEPTKPVKKAVPPVAPISQKNAEECFDYYLQQFEESFHDLASKAPIKKEEKPRTQPYNRQTRPKKAIQDERSDMERWLQAFGEENS